MSNKYLEKAASIASRVGKFAKDLTGENVRNVKARISGKNHFAEQALRDSYSHVQYAINTPTTRKFRFKQIIRDRDFDEHLRSTHSRLKGEDANLLNKAVSDRSSARKATAGVVGATGLGVAAKKYLDKKNAK